MNLSEDIARYLPQYLSEDGLNQLKRNLREFAEGKDPGGYFSTILNHENYLLQGDCVEAPVINLPDPRIETQRSILLSNTCDMAMENRRLYPSRTLYAPVINLDKYVELLQRKGIEKDRIDTHIKDIKNQSISQILYLPTQTLWGNDSIVFFDRMINMPITEEQTSKMLATRSFILSDYGFYLLLLKLSYHFTRIQEKVKRS